MHAAFIHLCLHRVLLGFAVDFFILHSSSTSGYVNERIIRYVVVSCRLIFRSCIFFGFLVFQSTLFIGGLQPANYNSFCFGFSTNRKSYGDSLTDSLTSSTADRCRPRLLSSAFQGCFSNHDGKVRESGRFISREPYHARARAATLAQWSVSVVAHAEKTEAPDYRHRVVDGSLFHFLSHSLLVFPASMERSDKLQAFNSPNLSSV